MKNIILILFTACILLNFNLFAQNDFSSLLTQKLNEFLIDNIQEKIYIQTNSNEYVPGDTIWFKSSIVNSVTHTPVRAEKLLYIDLISPDSEVVYHKVFRVFSGFSAGYILVGSNFNYGSYKLVGYTNYMKNYPSDFFFKKELNILRTSTELINWKFQPEMISCKGGDSLLLKLRVNKEDGVDINDVAKILFAVGDQVKQIGSAKITNNFGIYKTFISDSLLNNDANITVSLPYYNNSIGRFKLSMPDAKPDLQFLPESGHLILGVTNTVAFKCIDVSGNPIAVSGAIFNANHQFVTKFKTEEYGMGSCLIIPGEGDQYNAEVEWDGEKISYQLPRVENNSYGLHLLKNTADSLFFLIVKPTTRLEKLVVLGHTRGIIHFFTSGGIEQKTTTLAISKNNFPSGIAVFTLLVKNFPRAERLVYIQSEDQLQVIVTSNKQQFGKRDRVELDIMVTDQGGNPVKGSFSLNAFDADKEQSLNPLENIQNYLLCSSELNGTVFQTLDYFNRENSNSSRNLDLLMLTNGWRRFVWSDVYSNFNLEKTYEVETGLSIEGEVRRAITNKPVPKNISVSITMNHRLPVYHAETVTDEFGKFYFNLPDFNDSASFIIQTKNRLNKSNDYIIELHSNLEHKKLDQYSFSKVTDFETESIITKPDYDNGTAELVISKSIVREKRFDNYYFPGKDTFLIEEVEVHSNFLSQRDSLIHKTGEPDVVIEAAQVKKLVERRDWYSSLWDLLRDQVPGLNISQQPYNAKLAERCNLVIRGEPECVFFDVPDNPNGFLHIIVDGNFIGRGAVKMYDFLSYMDPSEIESVNFIARPKKYEAPGFNDLIDLDVDIAQDVEQFENYDLMFQRGVSAINATNEYMDTLSKMMSPPSYLYITTKSKQGIFNQKTPGMVDLYLAGFSDYKEFYAPKYENVGGQKQVAIDMRKTLFWEPNVITDSTGATSLSFYTSDSDSPISIIVQGISLSGQTGVANITLNSNLKEQPKKEVLVESTNKEFYDDLDYSKLHLIKGIVLDATSKTPLIGASITQLNPYYHVSCNREGEFIIDVKKLVSGGEFVIDCPGYVAQTTNSQNFEINMNRVELHKASVQVSTEQKSAFDIVRTSIRKSWGYYDSDNVFQGYYREVIAVNQNYFGIYESGFNYTNKLRAGIARSLLFETDKVKNMEDRNGHKLLILKPNHRSIYYPLKNDILSFAPAFWDYSQLSEFNFEVVGEVKYDDRLCYKISFDMKEDVIFPLEKGLLYIEKESFALRSAQWNTSPSNMKYFGYTRYLQSNPMDYQLAVRSNSNQVNYAFIDGNLILQSTKSKLEVWVNNTDMLQFENELSVFGESYKQAKYIENSTYDLLIEEGETKHYLIQEPTYQIEPWIGFGMIKPESYLLRDARFLHDVTLFR